MERWQQVESLFHEALQRDPADRDAWLREACHGDAKLQGEVASLLANHQEASDSQPWAAAAAAKLISGHTSLQPGQRLGPYEILAPIGAGGMGEVYKARDTRLKRDVAIKICAAQFSERFEREARAIASLNHPNICQLYDVGPNFLVMELVEGENLSGPLPVETALNYARQIAEALEAAHEKGIVHRDLKPGNVKVTPAGVVKVLDFGLAKAAEEPVASADPSNSPTLTMSPTRAGVILGTAAYMAPEQARGAAVDKRADIWAFGCVVYEMLTSKPAFHGETTSDILAAVLKEEPDWSRIPARVQLLLRRCLVKDPKHRLRDIGDAMPLLDAVPEATALRRPWPWIAAALGICVGIIAAVGWWRSTRPGPLRPLMELSAELSPDTTVSRFLAGNQLAISPDGMRLAVAVDDVNSRKYHLVTRRLDQSEFASLPAAEGANRPFFSPNGQWIAFIADGKLQKISVQGGSPLTLCPAPTFFGASWGDDDNIIAALKDDGVFWRISASAAGAAIPATALDRKNGEVAQVSPQVLPGSHAVLFTSVGKTEGGDIDVISFKTGERKTLLRGGESGRYVASSDGAGYLVYIHQGTLFAAPFDLSSLALTGSPEPLLEDVSVAGQGRAWNFDLSRTGTFVYFSSRGHSLLSLFWLNATGEVQPVDSIPGSYKYPRFSPDGKRLAFEIETGPLHGDIWVRDLDRNFTSRLTTLPGESRRPVWTPDGKDIVFEQFGTRIPGMYQIHADGSGEAQRLAEAKPRKVPSSFSANRLAFDQLTDGRLSEIWTAAIEGDRDHPLLGKAEPFLRMPFFSAYEPAFSPDGHWVAYHSNETGTFEVYVRPFPGPGKSYPISAGGGTWPVWSRDGQELFFLDADRRIMVVRCKVNGDSFTVLKREVWSEKRLLGSFPGYDMAPDGKRAVVLLYRDGTSQPKPYTHVKVLLNFSDELRRRMPASGL